MGLNLVDQLAFYSSFHQHKWNQLVHLVCIPGIWASFIILCAMTGPLIEFNALNMIGIEIKLFPSFLQPFLTYLLSNFVLNGGFLVWLIYSSFYFYLAPFISLPWNGILFLLYIIATDIAVNYSHIALQIFITIQLIGWLAQIAAHSFIEGNRPALLTSLWQGLLLAPLFVWIELLFMNHYYIDLRTAVNQRVQEYIKKEKASKKLKK